MDRGGVVTALSSAVSAVCSVLTIYSHFDLQTSFWPFSHPFSDSHRIWIVQALFICASSRLSSSLFAYSSVQTACPDPNLVLASHFWSKPPLAFGALPPPRNLRRGGEGASYKVSHTKPKEHFFSSEGVGHGKNIEH